MGLPPRGLPLGTRGAPALPNFCSSGSPGHYAPRHGSVCVPPPEERRCQEPKITHFLGFEGAVEVVTARLAVWRDTTRPRQHGRSVRSFSPPSGSPEQRSRQGAG
ncbi:hypothetical protein AAFF_G00196040 [Aldrovandia affinis]|uniref:Uncharacterized protein n=1 Tax=Aldrovandia affinis TaxID=143900 RepID=A0AAD7R0L3_9TELE|nr:hypothetical protein AAFF_G00196040 [Aldrovandia affinis]